MKSTQALSSAALLAMAKAQDVITLGDGPEGVSWDSVTKSANLTASQNFTGRDVSSSYPGSAQGGWEVSLALKDNVAVEGSDDLLTARTITMSAPEGNNATIDDSWRVCAHVFPVSSSEGWGQEFDTNCKGLVAPECVDDLMKEGRKKFGAGCPSWKITPSCLRDLEEQKGDSVILNGMYY